MNGEVYLKNIQFSVEHIVSGIFAERKKLNYLHERLHEKEAIIEWRVLETGREKHKKGLRPQPVGLLASLEVPILLEERQIIENSINELKTTIEDRLFSAQCLSGALLQLAKHGLSIAYGDPKNAPEGRMIGGIQIRDIIIAGRNQYMHAGEGNLKKSTKATMERLSEWKPDFFGNYRENIKAFEIIMTLEWITRERFESDMLSLLNNTSTER